MHTHHETTVRRCGGCSSGSIGNCPLQGNREESLLSGWLFAVAAMGLFLEPGLLAIVGASCLGEGYGVRFIGAILGLLVGLTGSAVAAKRLSAGSINGPKNASE